MRILFDSQETKYKTPFGTLSQGELCTLNIHIPCSVEAMKVECIVDFHHGRNGLVATLAKSRTEGPYDIFSGSFQIDEPGLYFYYFRIYKPEGSFRLF